MHTLLSCKLRGTVSLPESKSKAAFIKRQFQEALTAYLRRATETFDLSKNVEVKGDCLFSASSLLYDIYMKGGMMEIVLCVPHL